MDKALILFSRLPIGRETKTRLAPLLNEREREELHRAMWADIFSAVSELRSEADIFLYWTGSGDIKDYAALIPPFFHLREQGKGNLGQKMRQALREIFKEGYSRVCLMGTDVPEVRPWHLWRAFDELEKVDTVIGPSLDGGYWLIGMRRFIPEAFDIPSWGGVDVLHATLKHMRSQGASCDLMDALLDIDTPKDVVSFLERGLVQNSVYSFFCRLRSEVAYASGDPSNSETAPPQGPSSQPSATPRAPNGGFGGNGAEAGLAVLSVLPPSSQSRPSPPD